MVTEIVTIEIGIGIGSEIVYSKAYNPIPISIPTIAVYPR
jgi:hypothetical protein